MLSSSLPMRLCLPQRTGAGFGLQVWCYAHVLLFATSVGVATITLHLKCTVRRMMSTRRAHPHSLRRRRCTSLLVQIAQSLLEIYQMKTYAGVMMPDSATDIGFQFNLTVVAKHSSKPYSLVVYGIHQPNQLLQWLTSAAQSNL